MPPESASAVAPTRLDERARLYIDEDSQSRSLVSGLRSHAVDVLTSTEGSMNGQTDEAQLAFAASQQRVLFTFNVGDFCRIHAEWMQSGSEHYSVVTSDQLQFSIGERLKRLLAIVQMRSRDEMQNRLEFLSNWDPVGA